MPIILIIAVFYEKYLACCLPYLPFIYTQSQTSSQQALLLKPVISDHFQRTAVDSKISIKEFCENKIIQVENSVFVELSYLKKSSSFLGHLFDSSTYGGDIIDVILQDKVSKLLYNGLFRLSSSELLYSRNLSRCTLVLLHADWL